MKLLAMTCCCVDVYPHSGEIHPGGNALNIAADWAFQGKRILSHPSCRDRELTIRLLGATGADEYGTRIRKSIAMLPIDADSLHVIDDVTANHRICIDKNGDRYFEPDAWTGGAFEHYRLSDSDLRIIASSDVVAITFNDPNLEKVLELRQDPLHPFRLAVDFQETRDFRSWLAFLPLIDIFFLSGDATVPGELEAWSQKYDAMYVATLGAEGSILFHHGRTYRTGAVPVKEVVDTTGCGDAWLAAFLLATQAGLEPEEAMREGADAAAVVIRHPGGFRVP